MKAHKETKLQGTRNHLATTGLCGRLLIYCEREGQRREPAADDVGFVSERISWLPFAAPSSAPVFKCFIVDLRTNHRPSSATNRVPTPSPPSCRHAVNWRCNKERTRSNEGGREYSYQHRTPDSENGKTHPRCNRRSTAQPSRPPFANALDQHLSLWCSGSQTL